MDTCALTTASGPPLHRPHDDVQWRLKRRCALRPGQLVLSYGVLVVFSMAIALPFGWQGLWLIPLWCLLEITVAGALYFFYMLHASDGEHIAFTPDGNLAIEVVRGLDTRHYRMNPAWAHLERSGRNKERLWLCCSPLRVEVATQLAPRERPRIERELKHALAARQSGRPAYGTQAFDGLTNPLA
ncbi:MAG: putative transrane protein [Polaromonas sp.]|nr:putative transrane protein [Polaromonas sp.]